MTSSLRTVVCDIEANGLKPTKIWCIVAKDIETNEVFKFTPDNLLNFRDWSNSVGHYIGHNFLCYDRKWLNKILGTRIQSSQVTDTWILSMLFNAGRPSVPGAKGPHGLQAWGLRFGLLKKEHDDWSQYSEAMLERCVTDVELNHKVYKELKQEGKGWSDESIKLEHQVQYLLDIQEDYGFYFDQEKAHTLMLQCQYEADSIREKVKAYFIPTPKPVRQVTVRTKKDGSTSIVGIKCLGPNALTVIGGDFTAINWQEFNPNSPSQVTFRLDKAGWKPTVFNKPTVQMLRDKKIKGTPKICEENLLTLPASAPKAVHDISRYLILDSRAKNIKTWFDSLGDDGRVHGQVVGCGAITHRAAHRNPNTANIPATTDKTGKLALYGKECRECWTVRDDTRRLVGVDAAAIQLRVLAHYMGDDKYTSAVVFGKKENGTDVHTVNQLAAGLRSRDTAKTFIYALLLGAGDFKLGTICGGGKATGSEAKAKLLNAIPALAKVMNMCKASASLGYMTRLDGGRLQLPSEHKALACYLQAGEAVIMKKAYVLAYQRLKQLNLDAHIVGWIHDEVQIDCAKEDAEQAGLIFCDAIKKAGEVYNLNCPMEGQMKIGQDWSQTH